ncbi:hypothetical protein FQZ97_939420 [compost metagenome]
MLRVLAAVDVAAAGVVEVREIELVHPLGSHQAQQRREVVRVERGHGVTQAHLHAACAQQAHGGEAAVEGAVEPAKLVVRLAQAVQADAHVVEACCGDAVGHGGVDQRAVGGQAGVEAHGARAVGDVEDVGPHQRLTAGEDEHRHAKGLEVVHHRGHLVPAQLTGVFVVGREGVAVFAGEVAAPDQVPNNNWAHPRRASPDPLKGAALAVWQSQPGGVLDRAAFRLGCVSPGLLAQARRGCRVPAGVFGFGDLAHVLADAKHGVQLSERRNPVFLRIAVE